MVKHTNVITLPRAFAGLQRKYVTRSGDMYSPEDVALRMALVLRLHGTVEAVRACARVLAGKVCMEQQPKLKALSRRPTNQAAHDRDPSVKLNGVPDDRVIQVATRIIDRVCDLVGIAPGVPFELNPPPPPRCHFRPMLLSGSPGARFWRCHYCRNVKPV